MSKLRMLREKFNLTQPDLAERLGVCVTSIILWEGYKTRPRAKNVARMQDLFGASKIESADFLPKRIKKDLP